jgi:hypothetical protein
MMGHEVGRTHRPDGTTVVQYALSADKIANLVINTAALDQPGYSDVLDLHQIHHDQLVRLREGATNP